MTRTRKLFAVLSSALVALVGVYYFHVTMTHAAGVYSASYPTVYAKCASVVDATQSDCEALLDIYYGTRGTGWTVPSQLRWAFSGDATQTTIGDWANVLVQSNRVVSLQFTSTNMSGAFVSTIDDLTGLQTFLIDTQPNLRGPAPIISNKPFLTTYILKGTSIQGPVNFALTTNTGLITFRIEGNTLLSGNINASNVSTNPRLQYINISSSPNVYGLVPSNLTVLTGLQTYIMNGIGLTGTTAPDISTNTGLIAYWHYDTRSVGSVPFNLTQNKLLQNYFVRGNALLTGRIPTDLTQNKVLVGFNVISNPLMQGAMPSDITQNTGLVTFVVNSNPLITGAIPSNLSNNPALQQFIVYSNPLIQGAIPSSLTNNTNITIFQVFSNPLMTGTLPSNLTTNTKIGTYYIGAMPLVNGQIPTSIANNTGLVSFAMYNLPLLTGSMPTSFAAHTNLQSLYVVNNPLITGPLPTTFGPSTNLNQVTINDNPLITGPLPNLTNSRAVLLQLYNMPLVKGNIPNTLSSLTRVTTIDFRNLGLTGSVPANVTSITGTLTSFNIANNNLNRTSINDAIMSTGQMAWFTALSGAKSLANQGDIVAPVLAITTGASITSGASINTGFTYSFSVNEASYATGVGGTTGMTVMYTGCSGLVGSPTTLQVPVTGGIANVTATINISGMAQGLYTGCFVGVADRSGNVSNYLNLPVFTKDTIVPNAPTIISPASGSYWGNTTPTLVGTGEPGSIFTIRSGSGVVLGTGIVSGTGSWSKLITLTGEGLYNLSVDTTDAAGNVSAPAQLPLILSFTTITITAPTLILNASITDTVITVSGAVGINAANVFILPSTTAVYSNFMCIQNSPTLVTCSISIDDSGNLRVRIIDNQGNSPSLQQNNYLIDLIPPQIPTVGIDTQSPRDVNNPSITVDSRDNHILDRCEVYYKADDGNAGTVTGGYDIETRTSMPFHFEPLLDPDELTTAPFVHEILTRCYDLAGNISDNIVKFPPIIAFLSPVTISNVPISGVQVQITSPQGNDLDNIQVTAGSATLGTCIGSGNDTTAPYASPAVCDISIIGTSTTVGMSAEDVGLGAVGTNSQMFIIDTTNPIVTVSGVTLLSGSSITDTVITISDDVAIHTGDVSVDMSTTASYSNFVCTQLNGTYITCTVSIDDDGIFSVALHDVGGNAATATQTGYIIDTIPPILMFSDDIGTGSTTGELIAYTATDDISLDSGSLVYGFSADNVCDGSDTYISGLTGDLIATESHNGEYVCIRAMDTAGNYGYAVSANPLLVDITAPVVTLTDGSFVTIAHGGFYTESGASWTDNIDGSGTNVTISGTVNTSVVGVYTIEYTYTDHAGNTGNVVTRAVNVTDQTVPVTTLLGSTTVTTAYGTTYTDAGASWTDNVDGAGTNVIVSGSVDTGALGTYILEYWYVDAGGNISNTVMRTVHVTDQAAPVVTLNGSGDMTIAHGISYVEDGADWTDNIDGAGTINPATSGQVNTGTVGVYTLTYRYTDNAGNISNTVTRIVHVTDQTAPVVILNGSGTMTIAHGSVYTETGARWTDAVDGSGTNVIISGSVDVNMVGIYIVEYTYIDQGGNTGNTVMRTVHVTDQMAPVVTLSGSGSVTTAQGTGYTDAGASWTDNVDGSGTNVIVSGVVNTGIVGTYTLQFTYIDNAGNTGNTVMRTVHVTDQTAPVVMIYGSGDLTIAHGSTYVDSGAHWTDNVDGAGGLSGRSSGTISTNVIGVYMLEYTYVDAGGNTGSATRIVHVTDQTPAVVTLQGSGVMTVAHGGTFTDPGASWTDNVDGTGVIITATSGSVDMNTVGTYVLNYTYVDGAGNVGTITRTVHVTDQTPPVVTLVPGASTVVQGTAYADPGATWLDAVDGSGIILLATSGYVNTGVVGIYTLEYSYMDAGGNVGKASRIVEVTQPLSGFGGGGSTTSVTPVVPTTPTQPTVPTTPVAPVQPSNPSQPQSPTVPTAPVEITWTPAEIFNPTIDTNKCYADRELSSIMDQHNAVTKAFKKSLAFGATYELTRYNGTEDYRPTSYIRRDEAARLFATFARNVLCRTPSLTYSDQFSDLANADQSLIPYIKDAYELGIFKGSQGKFKPSSYISREEVVAIISRMLTNEQKEEMGTEWWKPYETELLDMKLIARPVSAGGSYVRSYVLERLFSAYKNYPYVWGDYGYVVAP